MEASWQGHRQTATPCCVVLCRIRITNTRQHPVKVLGRRWHIRNDDGRLEAVVQLSADNGVVGERRGGGSCGAGCLDCIEEDQA
jgi:hypothetical protein